MTLLTPTQIEAGLRALPAWTQRLPPVAFVPPPRRW
jgi:hypothetical protein